MHFKIITGPLFRVLRDPSVSLVTKRIYRQKLISVLIIL